MKKQKEVTILFSNRLMTRFMQDADMFEKFKVMICPPVKAKVVPGFGKKNIKAIEKQCQDSEYDLVAVYDENTVYYRNPGVKVVSTGTNWSLLDDYMQL